MLGVFDRPGTVEALALTNAGYEVHVICPRTKQYSLRNAKHSMTCESTAITQGLRPGGPQRIF